MSDARQAIARLTPLADVLATIDAQVRPVAIETMATDQVRGRVLAADVEASAHPAQALALIDGWALLAETTQDASSYAPAPLPQVPPQVEVGQPLPAGADCVAAVDAITVSRGIAEALLAINAGDGVLPAATDADGSKPFRQAGERLRAIDVAVFAAAGITHVRVRAPCIDVAVDRNDDVNAAAAELIQRDIEANGGRVHRHDGAFDTAPGDGHALVVIGGTGTGRDDRSVQTLARLGCVVAHGVALAPGETAAFGTANKRPVLLLPGRLDAALAVWLTLGRRLLHRLDGSNANDVAAQRRILSRKVASTVGIAELIPVRLIDDTVEPLAAKYLPWSALTQSDGWILVPAESEGYSAGTPVSVRPWP